MNKFVLLILFFINFLQSEPAIGKFYLVSDSWFTNINYNFNDVYKACKSFKNNSLTSNQIGTIFWCAKKKFKINYKLVLAILEKENELLTNPHKNKDYYNFLINRAMGVMIYKNKNGNKLIVQDDYFLTFDRQIFYGCKALRKWFDDYNNTKEIKLFCNEKNVIPYNRGTFSIYKYTPYYTSVKIGKRIYGGNDKLPNIIKMIESRT